MEQEQRRLFLIHQLLLERPEYRDAGIPEGKLGQEQLLRALMNVRPPAPVSEEFLRVQDDYLHTCCEERGVTDAQHLPGIPSDPRIALWKGDITTLKVDCIVNAANSALLGCFFPLHSCIDNIIHSRAGIQLRLRCHELMERQGYAEPAGKAKLTPAYNLPSIYVLHTVGPVIQGDVTKHDRELLASCYRSCLNLAEQTGCRNIALCCISTGEFHFPREQAAEIAVAEVRRHLSAGSGLERVVFDVFTKEDYALYREKLEVSPCALK